ncbi:hypothetical protein PMIN06_007400 [Paraphaeosphaeria minitans]
MGTVKIPPPSSRPFPRHDGARRLASRLPPSTSAAVASRHQWAERCFAADGPVRRSNRTSASRQGGSRKRLALDIRHANLPPPLPQYLFQFSSLPDQTGECRRRQRDGAEGFAREPLNTLSKPAESVRPVADCA